MRRFLYCLYMFAWSIVFFYPVLAKAGPEDLGVQLSEKILSQCGIASGLLVVAVVYLAVSNAKTRSAWEVDRAGMIKSYEQLAVSHAKLEGIVLSFQRHG